MAVWAGVDVGAQRKGFHVAAVDERRVVHGPANVRSVADVVELLTSLTPLVIGIDSRYSRRPRGRGCTAREGPCLEAPGRTSRFARFSSTASRRAA